MRSTARVTVLAVVLLFAAAVAALEADTGSTVPDRVVVVTGEDLFVLRAPEPAGWAAVELPETDLGLPVTGRDPPLVPPVPTWSAPAPAQVISLLEAPDA